jgi:predicted nucleic acid-binding protein
VSGFLLDTNVISELVKPRPETNVTDWIEGTDESLLYLSVLTLGEIRRGIAALPQSRRRAFWRPGLTRISAHALRVESWSLIKTWQIAGDC